jgi:predicted lipid-binding transport protein (Tim44 family)
MKMDWKTSLGTVALYSVGGAAAGYYAVGSEHSSSAAVERTFVTPADRTRGAQRGGMIGGLFGVGLIGLVGTMTNKGTRRLVNGSVALLGFGGLLWSVNKFRTERTAEAPRGTASVLPTRATTVPANEASTPPAQLDADIAQTLANEFDGGGVPSDADLLAAGGGASSGMTGLGRLAALRMRGAAPFNPRYYR